MRQALEMRVLWDDLNCMDKEDRIIISKPPSEKFAVRYTLAHQT